MKISRAAFAVILKFTEKTFTFEGLNDNIKLIALEKQSEGAQKIKDIVAQLKSIKDEDFDKILKNWETAN